MSEESIRIVMTLTQFTSRFTIALGTLQNMLVNAEGGNQTENGVLPRPAIEEDEDEDDPDKLIGTSTPRSSGMCSKVKVSNKRKGKISFICKQIFIYRWSALF